ncbi:type III-B CRISPR-associated protein Cas10/Cmr2 [Candidatus Symbiobacter mobilis]|uniref:Hydrolase-like protein n=1 Tax=Candidatus Symbiobacter mobilis CR TaxID=946483 RepID=U5N6L6_9BURK|nr:type III-B CRISPR-associated protein Cas10/Cmr2 [Candidatus Symbiobacter mobilis]AGX86920.1 hydrolase-like protein [Candidatus Symbiobacter mobilis CR]
MTNYTQKLTAWLHDPAEKQLVLLRDPAGHEGGTVAALSKLLELNRRKFDKRADHMAAAADRPNWPRDAHAGRYPAFEAVRFGHCAELIHPLSGERLALPGLELDVELDDIKKQSQAHFQSLIREDDRRTFLAFWRFGPEIPQGDDVQVGALWPLLPADSRTPDHSIWSHLDTVSAIHTALAGDENGPDQPALLVMSFGPVQGFIGQARSTSDLWAGSHLLSTLVWEALRPIVAELGPDVVVFPNLRGVPLVDAWLMQDQDGGPALRDLFERYGSPLLGREDDRNPLFAASLPNKFLAIVPSRQAQALAESALQAIKAKALEWAEQAAEKVFEAAGRTINDVTREQIRAQLADFPEGYWAAATWPLLKEDRSDLHEVAGKLQEVLRQIHPNLAEQGIFEPAIWQLLSKELELEGLHFLRPNAGILYPAVHALAERHLAATKALRPFAAARYEGHRCTLTAEAEWLTDDREHLGLNRTERNARSVWGELARRKPSWVKEGEHLGALATLKRMWPTLFAERVAALTGTGAETVRRFVVSTHALAISTSLENVLEELQDPAKPQRKAAIENALAHLPKELARFEPTVLPHRLVQAVHKAGLSKHLDDFKRLPAALEEQEDKANKADSDSTLRTLWGDVRPETYYALILMDGDRMGGWLSGADKETRLQYRKTWHSQILGKMDLLEQQHPALREYLDTHRPVSPGRHGAISQALNDFSSRIARHVVEECCKGKLLYAGGDDVLALVAVDDLFDAMQLLRLAYSGLAPDPAMQLDAFVGGLDGLKGTKPSKPSKPFLLSKGWGYLDGRLMTLMGAKATASMGAVVAHHTAPMGMVLRELRAAEKQAKNTRRPVPADLNAGGEGNQRNGKPKEYDRDAFCLKVLKRGGGAVTVTSPWWAGKPGEPDLARSALALMKQLAQELALTDFSRGAIYRAQLWFAGLTDDEGDRDNELWRERIACSLSAQFQRQKGTPEVARNVVDFVCDAMRPRHPRTAIENFLATSEFFAREARAIKQGIRSSATQESRS